MTSKRLCVPTSGPFADANSFDANGVFGDVLTKLAPPSPGAPPDYGWGPAIARKLSRTLWVDPGTTIATASQTGDASAPFATIAAALAAATDRTTIVLQNYDYTGEGALTAPAVAELNLVTLGPGLSVPTLGPLSAPGVVLSCFGVQFVGNVQCFALWCQFNSGVLGNVTAPNGAMFVDQSYLVGDVTTAWLSAINGDIYGNGSVVGAMYCRNSGMPDSLQLDSGAYVEVVDCWWNPGGGTWTFAPGPPGSVILDAYSNYYWITTGQALVNGAKVIAGDLTP